MKIEKFNEFFNDIKEGLIKTYPIKTAIKIISRELSLNSINYNIDFDESTNTIFIKSISNSLHNYDIINLFRSVNLCGYFISNYDFYDQNDNNIDYLTHKDPIDADFIKNLSEKIKNSYYTQITIESKYNSKVEVPPYLYHVTAKINKDKINKIGLSPKSKNKRANHNDRIYVGYNPTVIKNLAYQFSTGEYILLKISTKNLNITLYDDPDFTSNGSYTYNNIPPSHITIIDEFTV